MHNSGEGDSEGPLNITDSGKFMYPKVTFLLDSMPLSYDGDDEVLHRSIVVYALSSLNLAAKSGLKEVAPEGTFPLFTFSYSDSVEDRHRKFLTQTVRDPGGSMISSKASIVDEYRAAQAVVEALAINQNPISQLVEQLRDDYGSHIGRIALSDVVISLIKQTAYRRYRDELAKQIDSWEPEYQEDPPVRAGLKGRQKSPFRLIKQEGKQDAAQANIPSKKGRKHSQKIEKPNPKRTKQVKAKIQGGKVKPTTCSNETANKLPRPGHIRNPRSTRF